MNGNDLIKRFTYHPIKGDQEQRYVLLRTAAGEFADKITEFAPESEEREIAIRKLEEAVMWVNASIARNE
jgi:hypothetical protein